MNNTKSIGRLRYALTARDSAGLFSTLVAVTGVALVALPFSEGGPLVALALMAAGGAWQLWRLIRSGMASYNNLVERQTSAQATKWIYAGEEEEEIRRRHAEVQRLGAAAALTFAGETVHNELIPTNLDGTLIMPGTSGLFDLNGNPFGFTPEDTFSADVGTGLTLDATDAYSSPMGMDVGTGGMTVFD